MLSKRSKEPLAEDTQTCNFLFAELLGKLRSRAGLSRNGLVGKLHKTIAPERPLYDLVTDQLIKTLENGTRVNIPCELVEALCEVLPCTPDERRDLFLYARHSPLVGDKTPDAMAKVLYSIVGLAYEEAMGVLSTASNSQHAGKLNEREQRELAIESLKLVLGHLEREGS
jgi:hypothetical protein